MYASPQLTASILYKNKLSTCNRRLRDGIFETILYTYTHPQEMFRVYSCDIIKYQEPNMIYAATSDYSENPKDPVFLVKELLFLYPGNIL